MKIKEVTMRTGVNENTLRFYEKKALLLPKRSEQGYREYQENDIQTIMMIQLIALWIFPYNRLSNSFPIRKHKVKANCFLNNKRF